MSKETLSTTIEGIRRLVVTKQHLSGNLPKRATKEDILAIVRDLAFVQWDPVPIVAPSHVISLWSRLGDFSRSDLDKLLWDEKKLFLYWAPQASIVLTEDYPLYYSLMRRYPDSLSNSWGANRAKAIKFLGEHKELRATMLNELKKGPRVLSEFKDHVRTKSVDGWTTGSDVSLMLFHLLEKGEVMVSGHRGNQNVWVLSQDFLPKSVKKELLTETEFELLSAERAILALGTASPPEINFYFVRGRYLNLEKTLKQLQEQSRIHRILVSELGKRDERYIHHHDLPLLELIESDSWEPRLSLIAPFDNLISGRSRTNTVFGFDYAHEQFLPKAKRRFGTYVLPILWGEKIIGRIDPRLDKRNGKLLINSIHAEPGAPKEVGLKIGETIERLAGFLGASDVAFTSRVPAIWKNYLA